MGRRFWTGAASAVALVAFVGCGGDEMGEDTPPPAGEQPGMPPAQAPPPGEATPPAAELPEGMTQADVQAGQQLFNGQAICFTCHGNDGVGGPLGPNLTDDEWLNITGRNFEEIVQLINTGVASPQQFTNSQMAPRAGTQITDQQVRQIAAYVTTLGGD